MFVGVCTVVDVKGGIEGGREGGRGGWRERKDYHVQSAGLVYGAVIIVRCSIEPRRQQRVKNRDDRGEEIGVDNWRQMIKSKCPS